MPDLTSPFGATFTRAQANTLARMLDVLAEPTRLLILHELHRCGPMTVGELVAAFEYPQPSISHHTRKLADAGLIVRDRPRDPYRLETSAVRQIALLLLGQEVARG